MLAGMNRRTFLHGSAASAGLLASCGKRAPISVEAFSMNDLLIHLSKGVTTSVELVESYIRRIDDLDRSGPALRSVIELNPDAQRIAAERDAERQRNQLRGPLHGIPILIKDNIATRDAMQTTAGSLSLVGSRPMRDAFVVQKLREAGAIILGKTNLSEWANFRGYKSTSGWSARGGQTQNPYVLRHNPSGSSSGSAVAVAASLCAAAAGTETDGSIISPASHCGIVGLKPTVGLVSRSGIIPISHTQDTAGPMARTVTDAAMLLGAMTGIDAEDPASTAAKPGSPLDYMSALDKDGLRGVRIGVVRESFAGVPVVSSMIEQTLNLMRDHGAMLVEDVRPPSRRELGSAEIDVFHHEFKHGLNKYLSALEYSPMKSLADVIAFNEAHHDQELSFFGQEHLIATAATTSLEDPRYLEALTTCRRWSREEGIDAVMDAHKLDAIFVSTGGPAGLIDPGHGDHHNGGGFTSIAAIAGYPSITLPIGLVEELPVGVAFMGRAWSEALLLRLAYALEHTSDARRAPRFLPA